MLYPRFKHDGSLHEPQVEASSEASRVKPAATREFAHLSFAHGLDHVPSLVEQR